MIFVITSLEASGNGDDSQFCLAWPVRTMLQGYSQWLLCSAGFHKFDSYLSAYTKLSHLSVFETESHNVSLAGLELTRYQVSLELMESHVLPNPGIKVWITTAGSCFWGEIRRVLLCNYNLLADTNSLAPHNMSWALTSDQFCPILSIAPGWLQCMLLLLVRGDIWERMRLGESQVYIWQKGLYF